MGMILSRFRWSANRVSPTPLPLPILSRRISIIGLTGRAGSGKDTLADFLAQNYGYKKLAFADPLKEGVSKLFCIDPKVLEDRTLKERKIEDWGKSPRELMQWLGTDAIRKEICNEFFLIWMARRIEEGEFERVVISDVRFDLEADFVRSLGGTVAEIRRGQAGLSGATAGHASERGVKPGLVDVVIPNNGSLRELFSHGELLLDPDAFMN